MSIKLQLPKVSDLRPRLTVIGVGGAGGNAVNNMIAAGLAGVDFVVANTDAQALLASSAEHRIQLGANLTEGLGAGSKPEIGEAAAEEAIEEIRSHIIGAHMVFIAAGMGGGTGTGAAGVIARIAKEEGVLVVGIVTKPFQFEGARRQRIAEAGIAELKQHVDTLIVIPNQNLFRIANEKTTFAEAFVLADQVLYSGISCIVDLIVKEGLINLDFADVRTILAGMGTAMMGTGEASGDRRATLAAEDAISNPLLDEVSLRGAKGLLLSIIGGRNLTLYEVDEAASRIRQEVDPEANIIVGATFDDSLGDRVRVSIVASGMDREVPATTSPAYAQNAGPPPLPRAPQPAPAAQPHAAPAGGGPAANSHLRHQQALAAAPRHAQVAAPQHPHHQQARAQQAPASRADADADELRDRLSAAMSAEGDDASYDSAPDDNSTIAGAPWRAPGDVYVEEALPQLTSAQAQSPKSDPPTQTMTQPSGHGQAGSFAPAPPNQIHRPQQRRMPELEDFPAVGQRDYRAKAVAGQAAGPSGGQGGAQGAVAQRDAAQDNRDERRKPGLLERLTGRARRNAEASDSPQRQNDPHRVPPPPAGRVPSAAPQRAQQPGRPAQNSTEPIAQRRAAVGGQNVESPVFFGRDGK
jgi:cell division protein FtsZ